MSEPYSLYARLSFAPGAFEAFLASAPAQPSAFGDWQAWFDQHRLAGNGCLPAGLLADVDAGRVADIIEAWQRDPALGMPPIDYDAATGVCRIAMLSASENLEALLRMLTPLRGAAAWHRAEADDFIVVVDFLWGGEQLGAYVPLRDGRSQLGTTVPPAHHAEAIDYLEHTLAAFEQGA
ncbi:hypothetical protein BEN78_13740 [Xanthomonas citri pv. mangiferaeindicae]|nr:hypothetical protein BEN78_13740 [Xanthomonas citri pv. mangiferaeindicae]